MSNRSNSNSNSNNLAKGRANNNTGRVNNNTGRVNTNTGRVNNNTGRANNNTGRANNNTGRANNNTGRANNNTGRANNNTGKGNNSGKKSAVSSSTIFMIVAVVLLIVVLVVAGYFIYRYMKKKQPGAAETKQFIPYIHDASIDKIISYGSIPQSSQGNEYNINFWIYVNDYKDEGGDRCIIYKGPQNGLPALRRHNEISKCNPGVWLLDKENTLVVKIGLDTDYKKSNCKSIIQNSANYSRLKAQNDELINDALKLGIAGGLIELSKEKLGKTSPNITDIIDELKQNLQMLLESFKDTVIKDMLNTNIISLSNTADLTAQITNIKAIKANIESQLSKLTKKVSELDPQLKEAQKGHDDQTDALCAHSKENVDICKIENFPLQRWVSVNIGLHNSTLDVFFDGKLKKSKILKGAPSVNKDNMYICKAGFNGYISNMKYSNKTLNSPEIMSMYKAGPTV